MAFRHEQTRCPWLFTLQLLLPRAAAREEQGRGGRYLWSRATRRSLSSLPRKPLAKGLFSIFSWVICKRIKPRIKCLRANQTKKCSNSRAELVGLEGPSPDDPCEMDLILGPVFLFWNPDRENLFV